jgi:hypothetical protein
MRVLTVALLSPLLLLGLGAKFSLSQDVAGMYQFGVGPGIEGLARSNLPVRRQLHFEYDIGWQTT